MNDLANYFRAQAEDEAARNLCNYASAKRELTGIRKRLAEIKSQHEPLNKLCDGDPVMRDRAYAAAFYVVVGRFPGGVS